MSLIQPAIRPVIRPAIRSVFRGSAFSPLSLFANGEQGAWYDPSDLSTLFQDSEGTTPVTADGDPVGLLLDKSQGLALGDELKSQGVPGDQGTTTPATYNTVTGEGSVHRDDIDNQSAVNFTGLIKGTKYRIDIENTDPSGNILIRRALNGSGTLGYTVTPGERVVALIAPNDLETLSIATNSGNTTFTLYSFRELPGNHATQPTSARRPVYRTDGTLYWLEADGVDDYLESADLASNLSSSGCLFSAAAMPTSDETIGGVIEEALVDGDSAARVVIFEDTRTSPRRLVNYAADGTDRYVDRLDKKDPNVGSVISLSSDGSNATAYENGASSGSVTSTASFSGTTRFSVLRQKIGTIYFEGKFYGAVVVDRNALDVERANTEKYLSQKAGVTL